ncbi:MAG: hypothetical protein AVDCRST_MAG73-3043, partial [uncultured Thermomicrobiales bacterium]
DATACGDHQATRTPPPRECADGPRGITRAARRQATTGWHKRCI